MQRKLRSFALLTILLSAAACGDDSGTNSKPKVYSTTGRWTGNASGINFTLTLTESGGAINGSGTLNGGTSLAVTATGTNAANAVSVTMRATGFQDLNYTATLNNASNMSGALNGSGFSNSALTLVKQ